MMDLPDSVLIPQDDFVGQSLPRVGQLHEDGNGVQDGQGSYLLDAGDKEYHIIVKRGKVWAVWNKIG